MSGFSASGGLGYGQEWREVTGSRAASTSYQNTGAKPIVVYINSTATAIEIQVSPDNSTWVVVGRSGTSGSWIGLNTFEVPPGHYYRLNGGNFNIWSELS